MKRIFLMASCLLLILPASAQLAKPVARQKFSHPGVMIDANDLKRMKEKKDISPWKEGYAALAKKGQASLTYQMRGPFAVVGREPNLNRGQYESDCMAVFYQAIQWNMTGNEAYARKGVAILQAWARKHKEWSGGTPRIGVGEFGFFMVAGAEILRHTYNGWSQGLTSATETYFKEVYWPLLSLGPKGVLAGANQGAMQLQTGAAVAVYCNDSELLSQVLYSWYLDGAATPQNSLPNGQIGDMGRHQPHALIQIRGLAITAETLYKQGIDLFSQQDNRLLAVGEHFSNYNLGNDIPFIPYGCTYGFYIEQGHDRRVFDWATLPFEILINAYTTRKKLPAPFMKEYLGRVKPDEYTFIFKNDTPPPTLASYSPTPPELPAPKAVTSFTGVDLGDVKSKGSATYNSGIWTVQGAGKDVSAGDLDHCHFAYVPLLGDGAIIARVTRLPAAGESAKAGIMIRSALNSKDPNQVAVMVGNQKVETTFPINPAKRRGQNQGHDLTPRWVKLERRGDRILAYHCNDGIHWSITASAPIEPAQTVYAGLAVCSGKPETSASITFDHVEVSGAGNTSR